MFQSIEYLNYTYDNKNKLYHHSYKITDSDFISNSTIPAAREAAVGTTAEVGDAAAIIKTYENRNYAHQEIIKNLFLLNMFLLKENWYVYNINQILEYQNKYLTKEYYPEINFNEKYYNDLVNYTDKMMVLL